MTSTQPTLSGALAREHIQDLLRKAEMSRGAAGIPRRHRTPRQRPAWWIHVTARTTGDRSALASA